MKKRKRNREFIALSLALAASLMAVVSLIGFYHVTGKLKKELKEQETLCSKQTEQIKALEEELEAVSQSTEAAAAQFSGNEVLTEGAEEGESPTDNVNAKNMLTAGLTELKAQVGSAVSGYKGDWSVYVRDLSDNEYMVFNDHEVKAASLIKLYIMGSVYEQINVGILEQTEEINILLNNMITVSDNESANELVRRLSETGDDHQAGMQVVNEYANKNGFVNTSQGRDLQDHRDIPADGENYTSVQDCGRFLEQIYDRVCISETASDQMLELLKNQQRRWKIPAGLPDNVVCANKTGELADTENDAAIVYGEKKDYIICIMSQNVPDTAMAQNQVVQLSSIVYNYLNAE